MTRVEQVWNWCRPQQAKRGSGNCHLLFFAAGMGYIMSPLSQLKEAKDLVKRER